MLSRTAAHACMPPSCMLLSTPQPDGLMVCPLGTLSDERRLRSASKAGGVLKVLLLWLPVCFVQSVGVACSGKIVAP